MQNGSQWLWRNGRLTPWAEANVHVSTHALHYGSSVFEGIRAYHGERGTRLLGLDAHLQRLRHSAKISRLSMPYDHDTLRRAVGETIEANGLKACYIRPIVFRGPGSISLDARSVAVETVIMAWEMGAYLGDHTLQEGVDAMISSWRRPAPGTFPTLAKVGGHYINSQLATMEAIDHGFHEAICLDVNGFLSEGPGENVFLVQGKTIYTPPIGASILGGVNRGYVLQLAAHLGYTIREEMIPRELLHICDEAFFTGTAVEVTPVRSVDRLPVGTGQPGPVTRKIQKEFLGILKGQQNDRFGWMTPLSELSVLAKIS